MSTFALLMLTAFLLALPLGLRYLTAWRMRQLQAVVRSHDEELRTLRDELDVLLEERRQTERQERHFALRQSRLHAQVEGARAELQRLRQPAAGRLAA